jgi:hypothetical protein
MANNKLKGLQSESRDKLLISIQSLLHMGLPCESNSSGGLFASWYVRSACRFEEILGLRVQGSRDIYIDIIQVAQFTSISFPVGQILQPQTD